MKSAYIEEAGGPEKIKVGELPKPEPGQDEVLIRSCAAGVAPADWKTMAGSYRQMKFPYVPGFETAGIVERAPEGSGFRPGDAVFGAVSGGYAEFAVTGPGRIARKPGSVSFEDAAGLVIGPVTAYEALVDRLQVKPGETVLIDGASGGVGNAAVQIAVAAGARVYGVSSARNHDFVRSLGASDVFDYNRPGWSEAARAAIPGGVDVLLDTVGGDSAVEAFKVLKDGGRAALIASMAPDDIEKRGIKVERFAATTNTERLEALLKLVEEGKLRVELEEVYPLSDAAMALAKVKEGHTRGKIVLKTG